DTVTAITELGVGEALVSMLQDKGIPAPVQRVLIRPPCSRMGPATDEERSAVLAHDPNQRRYVEAVDPRSAHEVLRERMEATEAQTATSMPAARSSAGRQSTSEAFIKAMARSLGSAAGSSLGRKLFRGLLGSLLK
ncbi:MAG: DUF853 domain-containing protein, partial [Haliea sp.]|nr:DUF853 domain-containing protein [Haliea sp.]